MLVTDWLLLDYKRCQRRAYLNIYGDETERRPERDFLIKLRQESKKHTQAVLAAQFPRYQQPQTPKAEWQARAAETVALMAAGVECIYEGFLAHELTYTPLESLAPEENTSSPLQLLAHPHLLFKISGKSRWGDWQYLPISIQLGRRPKPEYKIVAAFYAQLLAVAQGNLPPKVQIILRRQNTYTIDLGEWLPRFHQTLVDCVQTLMHRQEPEVFISRQRCNLCHWHPHCYELAQSQQHLSLVPGVTPSRYQSLKTLGVSSIERLSQLKAHHGGEVIGKTIVAQLQQQALAIVEQRPLRKVGQPVRTLPAATVELYFDIEAEPERNLDYLLGVIRVDRQNECDKFYGFLAQTPEEEEKIWQEFVQFLLDYPTAPIYHFSEYERETIKRLAQLYGTPTKTRDALLKRCIDLHQVVVNQVICPVESYSLKSLANWLGFQWRDATASGDQSVCWYDHWLTRGDRQYLDLILRYNEDDCRATWILKQWLDHFLTEEGGKQIDAR